MNLFQASWIPVASGDEISHISYEELLCSSKPYQIRLYQDDLENAAVQLLSAMTQVVFPLESGKGPQKLTTKVFRERIKPLASWFDVVDLRYPFMQSRHVERTETTPIQKLIPGLPAGNNHAWFDSVETVLGLCGGCAAIAIFNQASNVPSFGGGYKAGLRGSAPATVLIKGSDARETVWFNTLSANRCEQLYGKGHAVEVPTWINPIIAKSNIETTQINLLRGLFWQPVPLLLKEWSRGTCDCCKVEGVQVTSGFASDQLAYQVRGQWPHPLSPTHWQTKKGETTKLPYAFSGTKPLWWATLELLSQGGDAAQGFRCAPVVEQFWDIFPGTDMNLTVFGYVNKKAAIIKRFSESLHVPANFKESLPQIESFFEKLGQIQSSVGKFAYMVESKHKVGGYSELVSERFWEAIGAFLVPDRLADTSSHETHLAEIKTTALTVCKEVFSELVYPSEGLSFSFHRFQQNLDTIA